MNRKEKIKHPNPFETDHHWGIILAGGDGNRLKEYTERKYGKYRPKQFCALIGTRSMLKHTIARAHMLIPVSQVYTVVTKHHCNYYSEELIDLPLKTLLVQPCPRGTSAGLVYPLLKIYHEDPDAVVSIFPSDHFIEHEEKFMNYVSKAKSYADRNPETIVMMGVRPEEIETAYGWIERGDPDYEERPANFYSVERFWEKPSFRKAYELMKMKSLLNTFVLTGRCSTFLNYINELIPDVADAFELINEYIESDFERYVAERTYHEIPDVNFSEHVLERIPEHLRVMEVTDINWSDWGEEKRVERDIERLNSAGRLNEEHVSKKEIVEFN